MSDPARPRSWWRRRRFSLTLRGLMIVVAVFAGWLGWMVHRARVQREAVAVIKGIGGNVIYEYESVIDLNPSPYGPGWLTRLIGLDYFNTVVAVHFELTDRLVDDRIMASIGQLDGLKELLLNSRSEVNDRSLSYLGGLRQIERLNLASTGIKGEGLVHIEKMRKLQYLRLNSLHLHDDDLKHLAALRALVDLDIADSSITDVGLSHLHGLQALTDLNLGWSRITSAGLVHLREMTKLQMLILNGTLVKSLEPLRPFNQLHYLNLYDTPLDDDGLAPVTSLQHLWHLEMEETHITDRGLACLIGVKELGTLGLSGAEITDRGLTHLAKLPNDTTISFRATSVTDAGIAWLKAKRPKMAISVR